MAPATTRAQERHRHGSIPWDKVIWSSPKYTPSQVDKAAKVLLNESVGAFELFEDERFARNLDAINDWRASHTWPLYYTSVILEGRALTQITPWVSVAHRLKRFSSIEAKLRAMQHMALTQMQDIGGCRAIVPTVEEAFALANLYGNDSNIRRRDDYISKPKPDGYRSIHLVSRFSSDSEEFKIFDGRRIEIQIRSGLQHAWATAEEVFSTFTRIRLRLAPGEDTTLPRDASEIGLWRRFFELTASVMAAEEKQPIIPNTPTDRAELIGELKTIEKELSARDRLQAWREPVILDRSKADSSQFLMQLDPALKTLSVRGFREDELKLAFDEYIAAERSTRRAPSTNVVLVSVDSLDKLRSAYPNYHGDTKLFLQVLEKALEEH